MAEGPDPLAPKWAIASPADTRVEAKALPQLLNLLSPVVHSWDVFAEQIGVPSSQVSQIKAAIQVTGPSSLYTCLSQALQWWVVNHHNPTYEAIIAVLEQTAPVMNTTLASEVKEFIAKQQQAVKLHTTTRSTHGDLGGLGSTSQPKDDFIQRNDFFIRGKFANLLEFVQMKLQERLRPEEIETKLRSFILRLFGSIIHANCIPISSNVAEIFEAMTSNDLLTYWSYFPLEEIINNFCNDDLEMKSKMNQYKKDRSGFQLATKIKDYIPKARSKFPYSCDEPASELQPKRTQAYLAELAVKLEGRVADYHLDYLEELWKSLYNVLSLPPLYLLLDAVIMNSVLVVWLIPSDVAPKAIEKALQSANFFKKHPIVKVTIGDECVFERECTEDNDAKLKESEEPIVDLSLSAQEEPVSAQYKELAMEPGGYPCEFVTPPPAELQTECRICLQILREPNLISCCGNHFCLSCIEPIKAQGGGCPLCKATDFTLMYDKGLERKLKELKVHCVHYDAENVCQWTGELQKLNEHLKLFHPNALTKRRPVSLNLEGLEESSVLKHKDFQWDKIVMILAYTILALLAIDIVMEISQGSGVQCTVPVTMETSDRDSVNNYCYKSLSRGNWAFIFAHVLALIVPQYLWTSFLSGEISYFFHVANDLNAFRTEKYDTWAFEIVRKLEKEYQRKHIVYTYILKLGFQFVVALFSVIFGIAYFYSFSPSFTCPRSIDLITEGADDVWPLNSTITCVYSSFNFLPIIQYIDCILAGLVAIAIVIGLVWCFLRHPVELGYQNVANFVVDSCFRPEHYVSKPFCDCPRQPHIVSSLDFLLLMLFHTDMERGKVFKQIQIQNEVNIRNTRNQELLQLFHTAQSEIGEKDKPTSDLHRIQDVHMYFKDRGFKGTPRHNVFRMFSSQFGIIEHNACNTPLDEGELKKIAEELTHFGEKEKVIALMEKLGCPNVRKHLSYHELKESELHKLLCEWLESQKATSRVYQEGNVLPPRKVIAGALKDSDSPHLKLTGNGVYYGDLRREPELEADFLNRMLGFIQFAPGNTFAMDISFGSTGCASILAWAFQEVASIKFNQHLQDTGEVTVETSLSRVTTLCSPPDIFVRKIDDALKFGEAINRIFYGEGKIGIKNRQENNPQFRTNFIMVGPIDHESKTATVNRVVDRLHQTHFIHDEAVLLAIRPLMIEKKVTLKQFIQYIPPQDLFKRICVDNDKEHHQLEQQIGRECIHLLAVNESEGMIMTKEEFSTRHPITEGSVSRQRNKESMITRIEGIPAACGNVGCLFEFAVYRYVIGKIKKRAQGRDSTQRNPKEKSSKNSPKQPKYQTDVLKDSLSESDSSTSRDKKLIEDPNSHDAGRQSSCFINSDDNQSHISRQSDKSTQKELLAEEQHESQSDEAKFLKPKDIAAHTSSTQNTGDNKNIPIPLPKPTAAREPPDNIPIESTKFYSHVSGGQLLEIDSKKLGSTEDDDNASIQSSESNSSLPKEEITEEEEYYYMRAQRAIRADGWKPPSRTPTEYSSDNDDPPPANETF